MTALANMPLDDDIRDRLHALEIDTSCALRFSRIAMQALASVSDEAREAIDRGLAEEVAMTRIEDQAGSAAVAAILDEARRHIGSLPSDSVSAARRDLERLLVEQAAGLGRDEEAAPELRLASSSGY